MDRSAATSLPSGRAPPGRPDAPGGDPSDVAELRPGRFRDLKGEQRKKLFIFRFYLSLIKFLIYNDLENMRIDPNL